MTEEKNKICRSCQTSNPQDARFCDGCGKALGGKIGENKKESGSSSHTITTVDASGGGVVAIGSGAKAVNVGQGGTYIEQQEGQSSEQASGTQKDAKYCPECDLEVMEKSRFCQNCGAKL